MQLGAKIMFSFEFVDFMTNVSVTVKELYLAWLQMDGHSHQTLRSFQEKVIMGGPLEPVSSHPPTQAFLPLSRRTKPLLSSLVLHPHSLPSLTLTQAAGRC